MALRARSTESFLRSAEVLASRTDLGLSPANPVAVAFDNHEGVARAVLSRDEDLADGE